MDRFSIQLVPFLFPVTFTRLDKHASLKIRNVYIVQALGEKMKSVASVIKILQS